jgi:CheY-like chemotaxis protein
MKVFLSSTFEDLEDHRAAAAGAIERLGLQVVRMETFGARPNAACAASLDEVGSSHIFLGIYAHRYGSVPKGAALSITEQEFDFAVAGAKSIFCFFLDPNFAWLPCHIDRDPNFSRLMTFKEKIGSISVRELFTSPEDLAFKVASSLGRFLLTKRVKEGLQEVPGGKYMSTEEGRDQVARRAARLESIVKGAQILLVNDVPSEMRHVIGVLQQIGAVVNVATTTGEAISKLARDTFDAVISDMARNQIVDEGLNLLNLMRNSGVYCPTIFSVGRFEPERGTPPFAFGITNRVDELLNLVFDVLERVRG